MNLRKITYLIMGLGG